MGDGRQKYVFSSPELKAHVKSDHLLSVVCKSCCLCFTFSSSSQEPIGKFKPNLAQLFHPYVKGDSSSNEGGMPFSKREIFNNLQNLTIFLSKPVAQVQSNLARLKHPWVKGIQILFKWRALGGKYQNSKNTLTNLKIFYRTNKT